MKNFWKNAATSQKSRFECNRTTFELQHESERALKKPSVLSFEETLKKSNLPPNFLSSTLFTNRISLFR